LPRGWDARSDASPDEQAEPQGGEPRFDGRWTKEKVTYEQAEDGAGGAHSPDVEGVFALGETREEVEARMAEALSAHLSYLRESGQPVPEPHTDGGRVAA
jgi:predicted RNase H-like HicB family nuclease